MNKKQAEEEALKKAKDAQAAAGKNSGMSGRDLVRDIASGLVCLQLICYIQFTYNPEWFEDEGEVDEEEWDLAKYRKEKEDEDLAAEEERIRNLQLEGGSTTEVGADDADGGTTD